MPTTLLDWSYHAKKAGYFAAAAAAKSNQHEGYLAVWALNHVIVRLQKGVENSYMRMRMRTAPRASNSNLHAQAGVFTSVEGELILSVDDYLRRVAHLGPANG